MRKVISEGLRVPIKMWLDDIDENALLQAKNLANLPFVFKHVALMPDSHMGFGMPIGGVIATRDVIIPNAVGVDIGCGMCATKTSLNEIDTNVLKKIMSGVRQLVPLGFKHHKEAQDESLMPSIEHVLKMESLGRNLNRQQDRLVLWVAATISLKYRKVPIIISG